jgi:hypothetical protein
LAADRVAQLVWAKRPRQRGLPLDALGARLLVHPIHLRLQTGLLLQHVAQLRLQPFGALLGARQSFLNQVGAPLLFEFVNLPVEFPNSSSKLCIVLSVSSDSGGAVDGRRVRLVVGVAARPPAPPVPRRC